MHIASTKKRVLAYCLDQFVSLIFYLPLFIKVGLHYLKFDHEILIPWSWLISTVTLQVLFQASCLYFLWGLPAQFLLGLRLVSVYQSEMGLSVSQCLIHAVADKLKFFVGNAIYYSAFWNQERRHIINLMAETRMVQKEPTNENFKPRWVLGTIIFVVAMMSGLYENITLVKHSKLNLKAWIIESYF